MPELPEVETTLRGIRPHLLKQRVSKVVVRQSSLRWPIPSELPDLLVEKTVEEVSRRGKYLLLKFPHGQVMIHLGMSGSLSLAEKGAAAGKHDHVDIVLRSGQILRYNDPRRFGCILWVEGEPLEHPLLANLGPEPLGPLFDDKHLYQRSRRKTLAVKSYLMDSKIVVGVGNIYANEALFRSGIHPLRKANRISQSRYARLSGVVRCVLAEAIEQGGTTLRDFVGGDGKPGYFKQKLQVYGRGGQACLVCETRLKEVRLGQRSTVYCPQCQH
ncbi:MAG: bifunctional DNA-formamidopyrimidine glycosylase/DNA-(apurinic or apyrimidinic site) lyase [Gammaproteobacteria bacterium]|nr:bifunctional DNA-formamidopyrimidine glycosylase/DNA-(apurinic or apyrimidinic site) lyase [Gammaproteobacteria bacterium]MBQ0839105.1 bifunctional DNA-formamidopyrimidine glycosylase/DNA-(apurinic or apyrimidinic site) lyase [Gammaproteobacteria bacterium]